MKVEVRFEPTPNPQSLKFVINQTIAEESLQVDDPLKAERSPLAKKIFGFPWCSGVFIGDDFVTVTKQDWVDWDILAEPLSHLIAEHLENQEEVLVPLDNWQSTPDEDLSDISSDDPPVVQKIKTILNREIRPAVAMDGGDITFHKYEDEVLYLHMRGSCSGCPSSTMTLKAGIEARLKEDIPELKDVVSV